MENPITLDTFKPKPLSQFVHLLDKEQGFFLKLQSSNKELEFVDADDFYEDPASTKMMSGNLLFITTKQNKLYIFIDC